eukprot:TRINITY_DN10212_c0_g1_i1.p1 TRINITY_DN10212_c0_g1~~TRINITY_DN10212_c0_g1_i1.p1  ORF type:complete len:689 (-),score=128.77 TRINITY_DN10212_c0_g1_i1:335-2401(-)
MMTMLQSSSETGAQPPEGVGSLNWAQYFEKPSQSQDESILDSVQLSGQAQSAQQQQPQQQQQHHQHLPQQHQQLPQQHQQLQQQLQQQMQQPAVAAAPAFAEEARPAVSSSFAAVAAVAAAWGTSTSVQASPSPAPAAQPNPYMLRAVTPIEPQSPLRQTAPQAGVQSPSASSPARNPYMQQAKSPVSQTFAAFAQQAGLAPMHAAAAPMQSPAQPQPAMSAAPHGQAAPQHFQTAGLPYAAPDQQGGYQPGATAPGQMGMAPGFQQPAPNLPELGPPCYCRDPPEVGGPPPTIPLTVRKEGPNQGRLFFKCSKPSGEQCNFFQWADEPPPAVGPPCQCQRPSKALTVSKECENKGRQFFSCAARHCRFFQWADEEPGTAQRNAATSAAPAPPPSGVPDGPAPQCRCGLEGAPRTVRKEGPNTGRPFFVCAKAQEDPQRCDFFQWGDDCRQLPTPARSGDVAGAPPPAAGGFGEAELATGPPCPCGQASVQRTVRKEGRNTGRPFFVCAKPQSDGQRCDFFQWGDQPPGGAQPSGQGGFGAQAGAGGSFSSGGSSSSSSVCFKCNQPGHWARDCTASPARGSTPPAAAAPAGAPYGAAGGYGAAAATGTCYRCHQAGHWARDCPNQRMEASAPVGGAPLHMTSSAVNPYGAPSEGAPGGMAARGYGGMMVGGAGFALAGGSAVRSAPY